MKARLIAVVLSMVALSYPLQAASQPPTRQPAKIDQQLVKIDLNKADVKALSGSIKGIGKKRAEAIIKYRENHGNFKSIDELSQVRGLGEQFVKNHLSQLKEIFIIN